MKSTTKKRDVKRVQIDMPPASLERMQKLVKLTEASSYAEVIRNSLRLYEAMIEEVEAGNEIYIKRDDQIAPYPVFSS